jgi:hypothetical protein
MKRLGIEQNKLRQAIPMLLVSTVLSLSPSSLMAEQRKACTEMAGSDYLQVKFSEPLTSEAQFTLTFDGATGSLTCPTSTKNFPEAPHAGCLIGCDSFSLSIHSCAPSRIEISVTSAKGSLKQTITPEYVAWYPNGEGCEPKRVRAIAEFNSSELPRKAWIIKKPANDH